MLRLLIAMAAVVALPVAAMADGCMMAKITDARNLATSPKQEAMLQTDGETVEVTLRTHFNRGPAELAWVVPVPAKPHKVEPAEDRIFDYLDRLTTPRFYQTSNGGGLSCGCIGMAANSGGLDHGVLVESSGTAGIFDYTVLAATDVKDLTQWLDTNGYQTPAAAQRVLGPYVKDKFHFLAMKIRAEDARSRTLAPHPIRYAYRDNKLLYPMVVSQLSADLENEVVLYVVAPSRYVCANWANATIDQTKLKSAEGSASVTNYEALFREMTVAGGGQVFFTEYCDVVEPYPDHLKLGLALGDKSRLTRLRALMTPAAMTRDVLLVPMAGEQNVRNVFNVASSGGRGNSVAGAAVALSLAAVLCLGVFLRPRGGVLRYTGLGMIVLVCVASAMI